jgi:hypothetical protein
MFGHFLQYYASTRLLTELNVKRAMFGPDIEEEVRC